MNKAIATLLILLGLWTNLMASMVVTCHEAGECCPVSVEDCQQSHSHHHGDGHGLSEDRPNDSPDEDSQSPDDLNSNDHHHHCSGGHGGIIAIPPMGQNSLASFLSAADLNAAYHASIPEAPTFSLEQPPRG